MDEGIGYFHGRKEGHSLFIFRVIIVFTASGSTGSTGSTGIDSIFSYLSFPFLTSQRNEE